MSLLVACGKQRNMGTDEGRRMRIVNLHSRCIWGGRNSGSQSLGSGVRLSISSGPGSTITSQPYYPEQ